ncbi:hypothetical protein PQR08_29735 [Caballeronia jiangsuensis]|uniref:Uncharacterized protein n=1 Tax=Caballeronia jiangsuensis TaxID=1458357 RepID=A0ABW9CST1_9BURK
MDKALNSLPAHGRVECQRCFNSCDAIDFDATKRTEGKWRITANPLAWGNSEPEVVVLGFWKGPTQANALASAPLDDIAYKGGRKNVGKILKRLGLLPGVQEHELVPTVDRLIADRRGRFHFGSLVRCTVERFDKGSWKSSGGGMLDKFTMVPFGKEVSRNCTERFLKDLPARTRLIVMFGLGTNLNYVEASFDLFRHARGGQWKRINDVAYTDGKVVVVHVEHFKSQGNLVPRWLGQDVHPRSRYSELAAQAVALALTENARAAS